MMRHLMMHHLTDQVRRQLVLSLPLVQKFPQAQWLGKTRKIKERPVKMGVLAGEIFRWAFGG
jgi:hypothetical protein